MDYKQIIEKYINSDQTEKNKILEELSGRLFESTKKYVMFLIDLLKEDNIIVVENDDIIKTVIITTLIEELPKLNTSQNNSAIKLYVFRIINSKIKQQINDIVDFNYTGCNSLLRYSLQISFVKLKLRGRLKREPIEEEIEEEYNAHYGAYRTAKKAIDYYKINYSPAAQSQPEEYKEMSLESQDINEIKERLAFIYDEAAEKYILKYYETIIDEINGKDPDNKGLELELQNLLRLKTSIEIFKYRYDLDVDNTCTNKPIIQEELGRIFGLTRQTIANYIYRLIKLLNKTDMSECNSTPLRYIKENSHGMYNNFLEIVNDIDYLYENGLIPIEDYMGFMKLELSAKNIASYIPNKELLNRIKYQLSKIPRNCDYNNTQIPCLQN